MDRIQAFAQQLADFRQSGVELLGEHPGVVAVAGELGFEIIEAPRLFRRQLSFGYAFISKFSRAA